MKREIAIGLAVVAGAAVLEAALVPGILLGGVALLAPRLLTRRRRKPPQIDEARTSSREVAATQPSELLAKSQFGRTIAKTITFRIVVTTLDFTTNYIVIGEIATAAGLSTFNLIAGPIFYFTHEAVWNYLGPAESGLTLRLPKSNLTSNFKSNPDKDATALTISPALAKTITYRTIATIVDFTTNYVVVGSVADAVILSSTGFLLGPFVYFGHEKAWEYLAGESATKPSPVIDLVPAAG